MIDRVRLPRVARRRWWLVALLAVLALGGFVAAAAAYQGSRGGVDARRGRIVSAVEQPLRRVGPSSISELTLNSSLGAEVVVIAGALDPRPAAVVALYGAANVGPLIAHTLSD